ncbi:hypothetical protein HYY73_04895 [Candidatus Woesearchaeota archaeon]|nr:hypothetical protein [Candidatus Woesearchaeota archaeon]
MKTKFVLVNHSILDFEEYKEYFHTIAAHLKSEVFEILDKHDFKVAKVSRYSELKKRTVFYNRQLDMELVITIRKKRPPEFV